MKIYKISVPEWGCLSSPESNVITFVKNSICECKFKDPKEKFCYETYENYPPEVMVLKIFYA